jgi:hypothetical protein
MKALGPADDNETRRIVLKLLARLRCSECGTPFELHDFVLQHHRQDTWVLVVECRHCGESTHVVIAMQYEDDPELASELTPAELRVVAQQPPITADDVLDMHGFLEEFDGDFEGLIGA